MTPLLASQTVPVFADFAGFSESSSEFYYLNELHDIKRTCGRTQPFCLFNQQ